MLTTSALRVQLALALGLPLVACNSSKPPEPPTTPPTRGAGSSVLVTAPATRSDDAPVAPAAPAAGSGFLEATDTGDIPVPTATGPVNGQCALDQVHEYVCGLTDKTDTTVAKVKAPAPHDVCGINPIPLVQFDDFRFVDSSHWGTHDKELAIFQFDLARTQKYRYGGTVRPDDVWCCYERCAPLEVVAPRTSVPPGMYEHQVCTPAPDAGTRMPAQGAAKCPAGQYLSYGHGEKLYRDNAPYKRLNDRGECCYAVASTRKCDTSQYEDAQGNCQYPERGRPLHDEGHIVVAPLRAREDWRDTHSDTFADLSPATRAYAAGAWSREAAAEHSSVASFARLSLELMMLGAPAELVDEAHVAARDEIRHATLAYGLASTLGGTAVGPGVLAVPAAEVPTLADLVVACFREGCVGEAVAAMAAAEARHEAIHAPIQTALDTIADDEARHAALAYKIVRWALREDANIAAVLRAELARETEELHAPSMLSADPDDFDPRLGVLSQRSAHALRRRVIADVVIPCTEALLGVRVMNQEAGTSA